jgi:hypothetical protein
MIMRHNTIREFNTKNYTVRVAALEEFDLDLSWDEDGTTAKGIEDGTYIAFCAHATVVHRATGAILANDYLGNCVYNNLRDFEKNSGYFQDMVHTVVKEARTNYHKLSLGQLHE